jgi:DNA modification methylase
MALLDNLTTQVNLAWDPSEINAVSSEIEGFDPSDYGFDPSQLEVAGIGDGTAPATQSAETEAKEDDFDPDAEHYEPKVKRGEVWLLGRHRLMCGDSTSADDVARLMNGERADLCFTDPPYGMKKESEGVLNDNLNFDDLLEFNKRWIPLTFANLKDNGSWYCWGIDEPLMDIYSNILKPMQKRNEITFRNFITWKKESDNPTMLYNCACSEGFRKYYSNEKCLFVMNGVQGFNINSDNYFDGWEPIRSYLADEAQRVGLTTNKQLQEICGVGMFAHWFTKSQWGLITEDHYKELQEFYKGQAFTKDYDRIKKDYDRIKKEWYETRAYFNAQPHNVDVWVYDVAPQEERTGHATPKPIALCARGIKTSSREGETVLDLFGGSGSTLIACEQLNRQCRMMELDPHYCDVIIARWEKLTGEKARKAE